MSTMRDSCGQRIVDAYNEAKNIQKFLFLLLVLAGRAVDAAGAVGGGAAPDALVAAGAVAMLARGGVDAGGTVARGAAPFAVLLVVAVFVLPCGRMDAS